MELRQFDVKTAFLNGKLDGKLCMSQPTGFEDGSDRVCKLQKSKSFVFTKFIEHFDFKVSENDSCIFVKGSGGRKVILAIYVDDGLIASNKREDIEPVIEHLRGNFDVKALDAKTFLGLELTRQPDGGIFVQQSA